MDFVKFSKIARWSRDCIVTEKIDGTNAQICINEDGEIFTGSRNRWITPENDNYGFARWAQEHKDELLTLGPGRHYGEWWGGGIQRRYGLNGYDKRFSLFNVLRYQDKRPDCCGCVPVIWRGNFDDLDVKSLMAELDEGGSFCAPGYYNPEGIVIYHLASGALFKKTFECDDKGKDHSQGEP